MAAAFSHVIFDLDGTILNTLEDLAAAGNHTCETHGWPRLPSTSTATRWETACSSWLSVLCLPSMRATAVCLSRRLPSLGLTTASTRRTTPPPYAGTIEMLDRLRAAGVQLAVLTNKDHVSAAPLIEKYFGPERFALVQGRVDAFPPKPEAPVTLHVMEELGANPATTLYVGDSNVDILTGHNAGLKSAGAAGASAAAQSWKPLAPTTWWTPRQSSRRWYWASNRTSPHGQLMWDGALLAAPAPKKCPQLPAEKERPQVPPQ